MAHDKDQVLSLLRAGAEISQIAKVTELSLEEVVDVVGTALAENPELDASSHRRLELARLDMAQLAIFPAVKKGDLGAIDRWLAIMNQRQRFRREEAKKSSGSIRNEIEAAIAAATHLGPMDQPMVKALYGLADAFDYLLANDGLSPKGSLDNVTGPTFLRYCDALGLTPSGRLRILAGQRKTVPEADPDAEGSTPTKGEPKESTHRGKLALLRDARNSIAS